MGMAKDTAATAIGGMLDKTGRASSFASQAASRTMTGQACRNMSRRGFVQAAGAVAGVAAAVLACEAASVASRAQAETVVDPASVSWDGEADVIVCGGGGGLLAACDAADAGNEVILLEKAPMLGGESSMNEGWINGAGTSVQKEQGVTDDAATQAADYAINHSSHINNVDQELLSEYCSESGASIERLIELGCEYVLCQDTMFYTSVPRAHLLQPDASAWPKVLGAAAEERGVQIMLETPFTDFVVDGDGMVIGVVSDAGDGSSPKHFKARKGVILATGDVSGNERMKAKFQPDYAAIPAWDQYNTGDGLFAALALGADSSFDQYTAVGPCLTYYPTGSVIDYYQKAKGAITVNLEGKRFANESIDAVLAAAQYAQTDGTAFTIFDSRIAAISHRPDCSVAEINAHALAGECVELGLISGMGPAYLEDYLEAGTAVEADTIEELAEKCGIDVAALAETVKTWNAAVASGVDEEFGRTFGGAMQYGETVGIEEAPFYALRMQSPKWMCTEGPNLMVNTDMNVLNVKGEPIERLYACGAGIMAGTCTLYANSCGDHMGVTAFSARRAAARVSELASWEQ
jgi:hypothetical protein